RHRHAQLREAGGDVGHRQPAAGDRNHRRAHFFLVEAREIGANSNATGPDDTGPFLMITSTMTGSAHRLGLTPVDSVLASASNVVGSSWPAKLMMLSPKKLSPVTISGKSGSPIIQLAGDRLSMTGSGTSTFSGTGKDTVCGSLMLAVNG